MDRVKKYTHSCTCTHTSRFSLYIKNYEFKLIMHTFSFNFNPTLLGWFYLNLFLYLSLQWQWKTWMCPHFAGSGSSISLSSYPYMGFGYSWGIERLFKWIWELEKALEKCEWIPFSDLQKWGHLGEFTFITETSHSDFGLLA